MRALRLFVVVSLFIPVVAAAQQAPPPPPPGECVTTTTTTTTTRCTGDAAPLAVPPPSLPQQPAPVAAPPPPAYAPPLPPWYTPPPPSLAAGAHAIVPGHPPVVIDVNGRTRVVVDPDGSMWQEVTRSTPNRGGIAAGLTLFLTTWGVTAIGGQIRGNPFGWWPIFGGYLGAIGESWSSGGMVAGYVVSGLVQTAGFITALVSAGAGPKKVERIPLVVGPGGIAGRF